MRSSLGQSKTGENGDMLQVLKERDFPYSNMKFLAAARGAGLSHYGALTLV